MLSPTYRVREFQVEDVTPFAVNVSWGPAGAPSAASAGSAGSSEWGVGALEEQKVENTMDLFTVDNDIPSLKMLTFKDKVEPLQVSRS